MAFPRTKRLRDPKHIALLLKKGQRSPSPFFRAFSLPSTFGKTLIGVVVSGKQEARATKRNRIRRRLQEAISVILAEFEEKMPPQLIVFFANNSVENADFVEIQTAVSKYFSQLSAR